MYESERFILLNNILSNVISNVRIDLLTIMILLILVSSFFSMSETVFSSVSTIRLKRYIDDNRRGAKKALWITENFDRTITTILVGNNLANIALTTIAYSFFSNFFVEDTIIQLVNTVVMTIIVLIFGEIVPKSFAKIYADRLSLQLSGILYFIIGLLKYVTYIFIKIKSWIVKDDNVLRVSVTGDELETIIDTMEEEGSIDEDEAEMLQSVLDLHDKNVYEIMTPRVDMVGIDIEDSIEEIKEVFFTHQFSRIPVYEETRDNVIGVLHERDFFTCLLKGKTVHIKKLMSEPFFVSKSMKVDTLIETLQRESIHLAIVAGEFGGTSGIVTMEDALEELVGEIYDEHDDVEDEMIVQIKENKYILDADLDLEDLFDYLEMNVEPESNYSTVGGWLYEQFEDSPEEEDYYIYNVDLTHLEKGRYQLKFVIKDIKERRISSVNLTIEELNNEEG